MAFEVFAALADGVGGALKPVFISRRLFGGEDIDEAPGKMIEVVRVFNMGVQGSRVVLGKDKHPFDARVDTIGNRDIDQAVFPADGDSRFGALIGEGVQAGTGAAAEDKANHLDHGYRLC